ncbi:MAG: site-specific integrase [Roseburia sp.]|nr:site-specific integrase [Roseburia sp.]
MTSNEWLSIGYDKGIIEDIPDNEQVSFYAAYRKWFLYKMKTIKPESLDRIECTFNRYYRDDEICITSLHLIDNEYIVSFLRRSFPSLCDLSLKEFRRFYQIINNVLVYARDFNFGHANLIDWGYVNRFGRGSVSPVIVKDEYAVSERDRNVLFRDVVFNDVYPLKRSAALCVVLDFFLGLRIGELAALKFSDFDLFGKRLFVQRNEVKYFSRDDSGERAGTVRYEVVDDLKTKSSRRVVPLVPEALFVYELIVEHHKQCKYDSPYLCYDGTDTIRTRSLSRTLDRLCKLCCIKSFNFHRIRKTYASMLHMNGLPTRVISSMLGHSDISTTEQLYILDYEDKYSTFYTDICTALKNVALGTPEIKDKHEA